MATRATQRASARRTIRGALGGVDALWTSPAVGQAAEDWNVDDLSLYFVNSCYGAHETTEYEGINEIMVIVQANADALVDAEGRLRNDGKRRRAVMVGLADDTVLRGLLADAFLCLSLLLLVGACVDLRDAFKGWA